MKYFKIEEFACECCGVADMDQSLLWHLDYAREVSEVPFSINSGYRCKKHNKEVGGKPESAHLTGNAVDIATPDSRTRFKVIMSLMAAGFNRLGIYDTFVHVDNDKTKPHEVTWVD